MMHQPEDFSSCRAALYIRLSREDEEEGPSVSIRNQKLLLQEFAERNGIPVQGIYADDGVSGTSFDRPMFNRMIEEIRAGKVNMVLTKDLSRLGRDYILTGYYMEHFFPEHGVRYLSLLDGIDTGADTAANELVPFRAVFNDLYARDISKKIRSVKRRQQRSGLFIGGKALYGYRKDPEDRTHLIPDPKAAEVVRRIFALASAGCSCRRIAEMLNEEGVLPPSAYARLCGVNAGGSIAAGWSGERISEMIRNETYLGSLVQGRREKISYKSKKCRMRPPEEWSVVPETHEPLVDQETFEEAGTMLKKRRHTRSRTYDFPYKGLIYCRECGRPLAAANRRNAAGEDVLYLMCRTYQKDPGAGLCSCHGIRETALREAVGTALYELCLPWLTEDGAFSLPQPDSTEEAGRKIKQLQKRRDRMYEDYLDGLLEKEEFVRLSEPLRTEEQNLKRQKEEKKPALRPDLSFFSSGEAAAAFIDRMELTEDKELILFLRVGQ